jgi:hypothetical protein
MIDLMKKWEDEKIFEEEKVNIDNIAKLDVV